MGLRTINPVSENQSSSQSTSKDLPILTHACNKSNNDLPARFVCCDNSLSTILVMLQLLSSPTDSCTSAPSRFRISHPQPTRTTDLPMSLTRSTVPVTQQQQPADTTRHTTKPARLISRLNRASERASHAMQSTATRPLRAAVHTNMHPCKQI